MPKPLLRLIATLLVPCLIGDPVVASAFKSSGLPAINQTPFQEEAIVAPVVNAKSFLKKTLARTKVTQMAGALVPAPVPAEYRDLATVPMKPTPFEHHPYLSDAVEMIRIDKEGIHSIAPTYIESYRAPLISVIHQSLAVMGLSYERMLEQAEKKSAVFVLYPKLDAVEETFTGTPDAEIYLNPGLFEPGREKALLGAVMKGFVNVTTKVEEGENKEVKTIPIWLGLWEEAVGVSAVMSALTTLGEGAVPMLEMFGKMVGEIGKNAEVLIGKGHPPLQSKDYMGFGAWAETFPEMAQQLVEEMLFRLDRKYPGFLYVAGNSQYGMRDLMAVSMGISDDADFDQHINAVVRSYRVKTTKHQYFWGKHIMPGGPWWSNYEHTEDVYHTYKTHSLQGVEAAKSVLWLIKQQIKVRLRGKREVSFLLAVLETLADGPVGYHESLFSKELVDDVYFIKTEAAKLLRRYKSHASPARPVLAAA